YSMPSDAPAYQAPPYHYRGAQAISIKFETDPEAALEVLPEPLELIEPACANLSIHWYPFTTFGPYHEAILRLYARHEGKPLTYIQQIFADPATTRPALAELIAAESQHKLREAWEGPGSISFPDHSAFDPVDRFPVRRIVKAIYMDYDITLPAGRVIARL